MSNKHHHHYSEADIQHYYEGDQSKLYSGIYNHHSMSGIDSPESKKQIKRIWMTTLWLTLITLIELTGGFYEYYTEGANRIFMITFFFVFTVYKAYLIVKIFMHLGDEVKVFINSIVFPLLIFVWFITAFLLDGHFGLLINETHGFTKPLVEAAAH